MLSKTPDLIKDRLQMSYIIDMLTQLGSNFWLILAGCIEVLIAVILVGTANTRTVFKKSRLYADI